MKEWSGSSWARCFRSILIVRKIIRRRRMAIASNPSKYSNRLMVAPVKRYRWQTGAHQKMEMTFSMLWTTTTLWLRAATCRLYTPWNRKLATNSPIRPWDSATSSKRGGSRQNLWWRRPRPACIRTFLIRTWSSFLDSEKARTRVLWVSRSSTSERQWARFSMTTATSAPNGTSTHLSPCPNCPCTVPAHLMPAKKPKTKVRAPQPTKWCRGAFTTISSRTSCRRFHRCLPFSRIPRRDQKIIITTRRSLVRHI